jgi:hypothetical protein
MITRRARFWRDSSACVVGLGRHMELRKGHKRDGLGASDAWR